jgi:long-chain acyl-CoA synthetase
MRNVSEFLLALYKKIFVREAKGKPYPWEAAYPDGLDWHLDITLKPISAILDEAVHAYPHQPCLKFLGKRYTYRQVGELVARAAKGFQDLGVGKGVKVGLFLPNSPYFVICYHAILKAGGTVVNFNPLYAEPEIARQIQDSDARIMVTMNLKILHPKIVQRLEDTGLLKIVVCRMSRALPFPGKALFALLKRKETAAIPPDGRHLTFERLVANDGDFKPAEIDPKKDVAVLQYTGGTTGVPKGAMLTHGNLYANTVQARAWSMGVKPGEEKVLAVLPLFHVFGMTGLMNLGLHISAEIILLPRFKVGEVLKVIAKDRPSILLGVPTIYSAINEHKESAKYDLSSLKFCISGGASLPLKVKEKFEALTGGTLVDGYGLTEAGPVCTINPLTGLNKPGSCGLPLPGTIIEIVSLKNPRKTVPLGETGEICVRGPQVMAGYWNHEDETKAVLQEGRLRTGDIGYMDEDGYVFIIDRIKDLIITSGFNVYPNVIEETICIHPSVEEAAVCGIPHPHRGETIKAYVKLRSDLHLTSTELRGFLKNKLAPFEIPRDIEFRDEIPKTLLGKPSRRELVAEEMAKQQSAKSIAQSVKRQ